MKKLLITIALMLSVSSAALAQGSFVVKAGLNFNKLQDIQIDNLKQSWNSQTGFHAGIGGQFKIPVIGLSFQPEILYSRVRTGLLGEVGQSSYDGFRIDYIDAVSYTHLRAHETVLDLVCRLLPAKKKTITHQSVPG